MTKYMIITQQREANDMFAAKTYMVESKKEGKRRLETELKDHRNSYVALVSVIEEHEKKHMAGSSNYYRYQHELSCTDAFGTHHTHYDDEKVPVGAYWKCVCGKRSKVLSVKKVRGGAKVDDNNL